MRTDYNIPGVAETPTKDWCGEPRYIHKCNDCGDIEIRSYSCNNWGCPTCYQNAAGKAGKRVEDRLINMAYAYRKEHVKLGQPKHFTFSPDKDNENYKTPYDGVIQKIKKEAQEHAKRVGLVGGCSIFHPYRIRTSLQSDLRHLLRSLPKKDRKGLWYLIRQDPLNLGDWTKYVYWSPHIHFIGYMPRILEKSDTFQKRTKWIYKNMGARDSVKGTAKYLLTHHAYEKNRQAATYWGYFSYNKATHTKEKTYEDLYCAKSGCGGAVHRWTCIDIDLKTGSIVYGEDLGQATKTVWHHTYTLKRKTADINKFEGGEP